MVNVATIERAGTRAAISVRAGDLIEDWRVVDIEPQYIEMGQAQELIKINLISNHSASVAPPPAKIKQGTMRRMHSWELRGEREPPGRIAKSKSS